MRVLDLFSGIGGFSLGLERAGMKTVAFVEQDRFCQRVLAKHWPGVPIYDDIREYRGDEHQCDLVCGGFPCQDISVAGRGAGLAGERSGLWRDMARIIGVARPRYVVVENVAALLGRGLDTVLGDLAALGYDAEWHCIPASAVGAPHRRDRVWVVAYATSLFGNVGGKHTPPRKRQVSKPRARSCSGSIPDANSKRLEGKRPDKDPQQWAGPLIKSPRLRGGNEVWNAEPDVGRVANGVPARVDRLRSLGNAVVPQIPELIGNAIMEAEYATRAA